jgi:hypothetical protein
VGGVSESAELLDGPHFSPQRHRATEVHAYARRAASLKNLRVSVVKNGNATTQSGPTSNATLIFQAHKGNPPHRPPSDSVIRVPNRRARLRDCIVVPHFIIADNEKNKHGFSGHHNAILIRHDSPQGISSQQELRQTSSILRITERQY